MEARSRFIRFPREVLLTVAVLLLVFAAMAGGYAIRLATGPTSSPVTVVSSGASSTPAQSDAPCTWVGAHKAC